MRPQPYIGITGFTHRDQINAIVHDALPLDTDRLVMAGVLVSNRTLRGETSKWPNRYPKVEKLKDIFPRYTCLLSLIHFNTNEPEKLLDDMCKAQDFTGPNCDGFQLNIAWPDPKVLEHYKAKAQFRNKTIVLQVGNKAFDEVERRVVKLAYKVLEYQGLIDYVLVDPSGGLGKEFDCDFASDCFNFLRKVPDVGFGIAGGLHPNNLERLRPLLKDFEFSIDAESKLRNTEDHLDMAVSSLYLHKADHLFREFNQAA